MWLAWPLLIGYAAIRSAGLPLALMIVPGAMAAVGVARTTQLGLRLCGKEFVVRRLFSTRRVDVDSVMAASFADPMLPGLPSTLRLRLRDGTVVKVGGVSTTKRVVQVPRDAPDRATVRVEEFLRTAGVTYS